MQPDRRSVTLRRMRGQVLRIATPAGERSLGIDGEGRWVEPGALLPASVDLTGWVAVPGLVDAHAHLAAGSIGELLDQRAPAGPARGSARCRTARRRGTAGGRQGHRRRRDRRVHHGARSRRAARGGAGGSAARHRRRLLPGDRHRDRRVGGGRPRRPVRPRRRALGEADRRLAPQGAWGVAQLRRGGAGRRRRPRPPPWPAGRDPHLRPRGARDGGAGRRRLHRARVVPDRGRHRHAG